MTGTPRTRLDAAYRNTIYRVYLPDGLADLRIGITNAALDRWLLAVGVESWVFITAFNPHSVVASIEENLRRHRELLDRLKKQAWPMLVADGIPQDEGWPPERSLLVAGIGHAQARRLASEFGQNAIVAGRRGMPAQLLWLDADLQH